MKTLNSLQMAALAAEGFSATDIGDRLGFTPSYIREMAKMHNILLCRKSVFNTLDKEHRRWRFYRHHGLTYSDIAWRFGRSKQAVFKTVSGVKKNHLHRGMFGQSDLQLLKVNDDLLIMNDELGGTSIRSSQARITQ